MRFLSKMSAFLALLVLSPLALAQGPAGPPPEPAALGLEQLLGVLVAAAQSGQWLLAVLALVLGALMVFISVEGVRRALGRWWPELLTPRALAIASATAGPLTGLVVALSTGQPLTVTMVLATVGAICSALASGTRALVRNSSRGRKWLRGQEVQVEAGRAAGEG